MIAVLFNQVFGTYAVVLRSEFGWSRSAISGGLIQQFFGIGKGIGSDLIATQQAGQLSQASWLIQCAHASLGAEPIRLLAA